MSVDDGNMDDYIVTAQQIFQYCGGDAGSTLRVDDLLDNFAPFVKTKKIEYNYLRSLLDPEQSNPEITVSMLANFLSKYSESRKGKVDLEESFNQKSGQVPQDSDSGISSDDLTVNTPDGFQLLEELQCELREKSHQAQQLRTQLDYSDRHHEEALTTVTAERDSLRAHLNMLREENMTLTHVRRDYEDMCERLSCSERALDETRRELECTRRRAKVLTEQVTLLENEKLNLQELLSKSKAECHRINDMYASRQSSLLEENETLRTEHADLSARMRDQEEFMQQIIKEKVLIEVELKDLLNKSNQTHLRLERSIDVSYTEDQMLNALDSLNADCRFSQENRLLDEVSFANALTEDQGRPTNMSLFDEIRLSFCNMSRHNLIEFNTTQPTGKHPELIDDTLVTTSTQTDDLFYANAKNEDVCNCNSGSKSYTTVATQTIRQYIPVFKNRKQIRSHSTPTVALRKSERYDALNKAQNRKTETVDCATNTSLHLLEVFKDTEVMNFGTQTDSIDLHLNNNNNNVQFCVDCSKCVECERLKKRVTKLEKDLNLSSTTAAEMRGKLDHYEENLNRMKRFLDEGNVRNCLLKAVADNLRTKLDVLESACASQREKIDELYSCAEIETKIELPSASTQTEIPCSDCVKRNTSSRSLKRYLWEPLKSLFQLFAVICFICALWLLYGLTRRWHICRDPLPWRWLQLHDLVDLFLTIEYVSDVPM